jgi:hypothetical protein
MSLIPHPMRARTQLGLFAAGRGIYDVARWIAAGEYGPATRHAHWVLDVEDSLRVGIERSIQQAAGARAGRPASALVETVAPPPKRQSRPGGSAHIPPLP